jgi:hypothetical protein
VPKDGCVVYRTPNEYRRIAVEIQVMIGIGNSLVRRFTEAEGDVRRKRVLRRGTRDHLYGRILRSAVGDDLPGTIPCTCL